MKRTIRFIMPVHFEAKNELALKEAIAEFKRDPIYVNYCGDYGWKQGRVRLAAPSTTANSKEIK